MAKCDGLMDSQLVKIFYFININYDQCNLEEKYGL